jgi:hypothetical protein
MCRVTLGGYGAFLRGRDRATVERATGRRPDGQGHAFEAEAGRYTGEYDPVDKRAALAEIREIRGWDYVVAAGDSAVDAEMAAVADCFLAVDRRGDGRRRFEGLDPVPLADPATLRRAVRIGGRRPAMG